VYLDIRVANEFAFRERHNVLVEPIASGKFGSGAGPREDRDE
jgi:hypothetical protein